MRSSSAMKEGLFWVVCRVAGTGVRTDGGPGDGGGCRRRAGGRKLHVGACGGRWGVPRAEA
eukprot:16445652-Heterocapsa_arctica.AAC.1